MKPRGDITDEQLVEQVRRQHVVISYLARELAELSCGVKDFIADGNQFERATLEQFFRSSFYTMDQLGEIFNQLETVRHRDGWVGSVFNMARGMTKEDKR